MGLGERKIKRPDFFPANEVKGEQSENHGYNDNESIQFGILLRQKATFDKRLNVPFGSLFQLTAIAETAGLITPSIYRMINDIDAPKGL